MEKISLMFLGTSDSIPTKTRNHPSILLSYKNENILIDCGEGTQRQFKIAEMNPCKLTRILLTHWHGDHTFGLPGLLQTLAMSGYSKTLHVYGPKYTKENFSLMKKMMNILVPLEIHEIANATILDTPDFYIETKSMSHLAPTNAYAFVVKDRRRLDKEKLKKYKLPHSPLLKKLKEGKDIVINNKKIKAKDVSYVEKGKKITIILDTEQNHNSIAIAKNADVLISESTFLLRDKGQAKEKKHLTAAEAATIAKKAKAKKLILMHISQRYQNNLAEVEHEAKRIFKNTSIAKDFDKIEI